MHTVSIPDQFEPVPTEAVLPGGSGLPSGRAMLSSGVLGTHLLRLAELAAQDDSDRRAKASLTEEGAR